MVVRFLLDLLSLLSFSWKVDRSFLLLFFLLVIVLLHMI